VAHGYWNQPEETQKTFEGYLADTKEGPFLRTGDLGYIDKEEVFITGRLKEMIIIRGTNHYPEDIEQTVEKSHPLLRSSSGAAFSIEADGEERLVIVQEVEDLKKSRINEVMENIREVVSKHYNIQVYAIALIEPESIPRTVTKKIQRYVSRAAFLDGSLKIIASWQKEKITKIKSLPKRRTFLPLKSKKLESWLISKISEKLGMDSSEINIEKPLVSYGLDSLSAVRLTAEIEEELGATLLIATLFESPSIKHIAQELKTQLSSKKRTSQSKKMHLDLNAEVHLDSTLVFETFKNGSFVNPTSILLTGATGFLGAFLLYEILKNTSAKVYCLARAFDQQGAKQRIQKNLEFFSLWKDHFNERITPVNGDLSKPLFGLPFQEFESLTQKIDIIYHIGAIVNFIYSYRDLKASNVEGTHEIIHLAVKNKLKPVHHISTISVFPLEGHPEGKNFFEQDTPFYAQGLLNGYAQSKWVAEKTMIVAREKGLPVTIYRVGEVIGHSKSGICRAAHDAYSNMIKGAILLGSAPEMNINLYLVPVDYVSRSIFHLSKETGSLGKNFHIVSEPMEGTKTLDVMASLGYPLRRLQYHEWLNEVDRLNKSSPQNPLAALMPLFTSPTVIRLSQATTRLKLDRQNLAKELEKTSIACSPAEELLMTYLNYLKRSGFLNGTLESLSQ
jgi:thioester reductase-like protein